MKFLILVNAVGTGYVFNTFCLTSIITIVFQPISNTNIFVTVGNDDFMWHMKYVPQVWNTTLTAGCDQGRKLQNWTCLTNSAVVDTCS